MLCLGPRIGRQNIPKMQQGAALRDREANSDSVISTSRFSWGRAVRAKSSGAPDGNADLSADLAIAIPPVIEASVDLNDDRWTAGDPVFSTLVGWLTVTIPLWVPAQNQ